MRGMLETMGIIWLNRGVRVPGILASFEEL